MIKSLAREANNSTHNQMGIASAILKSLLYSLAFVAILTFLLYIALSLEWIQIKAVDPIFMYGNYFAVIIGAAIAGISIRGRGWLIGLLFACIYFIIASLLAPIWSLQGIVGTILLTRLAITLGIGILGGMVGVNL